MSRNKKVYTLHQTYKDGDPDILGAYDSMSALCRGFSLLMASSYLESLGKPDDGIPFEVQEAAITVARLMAKKLPALLHEEWADDECRDGQAVYGVDELIVEGEDDDEDDNDEDDEEDD